MTSGSVTISSDLIAHAHQIFWQAIETAKHSHVSREEINIFTNEAAPAYICCVAAVEAFINELFFGLPTFKRLESGPLGTLEKDWLKKLSLRHKLVLFPQLLAGETFDRGSQPFQDMSILIQLRNTIVHYKMERTPPTFLKHLEGRRVVLVADTEASDYLWFHKVSCTEGVRWAINASTKTVQKLVEMIRDEAAVPSFLNLAGNFQEISEDQVKHRLREIAASSQH